MWKKIVVAILALAAAACAGPHKNFRQLNPLFEDFSSDDCEDLDCGQCVYHVKGDWDGDGILDSATLLHHKKRVVLLVEFEGKKNKLEKIIEARAGAATADSVVVIKKGRNIGMNEMTTGHVVLENDGFALIYCDKNIVGYYWDKKKKELVGMVLSQ